MKKTIVIIVSIAFLLAIAIPTITYYTQDTGFAKIVKHYSDSASIIIAILTVAYVTTTMLQFLNMQKQLNMMESSLKLQIQPLPIPVCKSLKLEKIRPYLGPDNNFTKIEVMNRVHATISLHNHGNGIPFKIHIFPSIILKDGIEIPQPLINPKKVSIISDEKQPSEIKIMFFDDKFKILEYVKEHENIKVRFEMLYKNIFGAGFYSKYEFIFTSEEEGLKIVEDSLAFIKNDMSSFKTQFEKHMVLKPIDSDDAKKIFNEVKESIKNKFNNDIIFKEPKESSECEIEVVDFDKKIKELKKYYSKLVEINYNKLYNLYIRNK